MSFPARYHGRCAGCDDPIEPGELVRYEDDELVHDDCATETPPQRPVNVCAECHLVPPCDCTEPQ